MAATEEGTPLQPALCAGLATAFVRCPATFLYTPARAAPAREFCALSAFVELCRAQVSDQEAPRWAARSFAETNNRRVGSALAELEKY